MEKERKFKVIENTKEETEKVKPAKKPVSNPIYKKAIEFSNRPIKEKYTIKDFIKNVFQ